MNKDVLAVEVNAEALAEEIELHCDAVGRALKAEAALKYALTKNILLRAKLAEAAIVCARLTAWKDGYGGVEITLAGGRKVAIALDAPIHQEMGT